MELLLTIAKYSSYVIAGLIVMLNGIAPLTKSDKDDKLLSALRWFESKVLSVLLPQASARKLP